MITPSKWANKRNLDNIREIMMSGHLMAITAYTNSNMCFNGIDIAGGVSHFIIDKVNTYKACRVEYITKECSSIDNREISVNNNVMLNNEAFKVASKMGKYTEFVPASGDNPFGILSNQHGSLIEYNDKDAILIKDDFEEHFELEELKDTSLVYKYKITIGKMNPDRGGVNGSESWNVINVPKALRPRYIIPQNFMVLFASDSPIDATNFYKYCKTKLFRFLALQGMSGASLSTAETWRFVPLQDFTNNSDIDWSQSIANIDQQLYKKYNLTQEEIDYIEKTIKPME